MFSLSRKLIFYVLLLCNPLQAFSQYYDTLWIHDENTGYPVVAFNSPVIAIENNLNFESIEVQITLNNKLEIVKIEPWNVDPGTNIPTHVFNELNSQIISKIHFVPVRGKTPGPHEKVLLAFQIPRNTKWDIVDDMPEFIDTKYESFHDYVKRSNHADLVKKAGTGVT